MVQDVADEAPLLLQYTPFKYKQPTRLWLANAPPGTPTQLSKSMRQGDGLGPANYGCFSLKPLRATMLAHPHAPPLAYLDDTNSKAGSNKPADHTLLGVLICIRSVVYGNAQCCQQQCCQHCASVLALQVAGENSMEVLQRAMQNSHRKCTALVVTLDPSVGARCMLAALCTQAVLHGGAQRGAIRSAVLMAGSTRSAEVQRSLVRCTGVLLSHLVSLPTPGWVPNRFV